MDPAVRVLNGDALTELESLEPDSVDCVVTSPPYWRLRDYHVAGQLGQEATVDSYVAALVAVFREVRRVLKPAGTFWLNLGDTYAGPGLPAGNLVGVPWRVALALQADGWILRQDIIWAKPNPMPESVGTRCTKAHEYLFLLTKTMDYYFDYESIMEPSVTDDPRRPYGSKGANELDPRGKQGEGRRRNTPGIKVAELVQDLREIADLIDDTVPPEVATERAVANRKRGEFGGKTAGFKGREAFRAFTETRRKRSVWTVPPAPFKGAHFATFPPGLVEPCILAGSAKGGLVLDPFAGSGTVGVVARILDRRAVLIELNPDYAAMAAERTAGALRYAADVEALL